MFDPVERAVMATADELVTRGLVEDATFNELKQHLGDSMIVDLIYTIAAFEMKTLLIRGLHLGSDDDTTRRLTPVEAKRKD